MHGSIAVAVFAVVALAAPAGADPLTITSGTILTYEGGTSFLVRTSDGFWLGGDTEGPIPPPFLSGTSGDVVNLSSSVDVALTGFGVFDPVRRDLAARAVFQFVAGDAILPSAAAVASAPGGFGLLSVPFTFEGTLFVYPTYAALQAGGPAATLYELRGVGTADARLFVSQTNDGQPIFSDSALYTFASDPAAVPEPGTLLLSASGAAALAARRRKRLQR